ncbi:N-acetylmannosamine kinase [Psychromonas sp. CNPT3]|uniref:N-acetylmannosamine kinase n=1 Tax=Psychromonas sp. CNPT3 TaxID=314282 RepID=UPI00006E5091|nr:N-acetylmannosamine kinase [Psychromonas sp. CNPT3]AGH82467.1 N-acetylmannosamine kinase [Psychromonas sp. CNPT3]
MKTCLAVDIGGTKIAATLIRDGVLTRRMQVKTPASSKAVALDGALKELLSPLLSDADYIAIASTGIIHNGIISALNPSNLGGLKSYPLKSSIEKFSSLPVFILNDAQAATWAEFQHCQVQNMAFITISTGVGAGIVINNKLLTGYRSIAGHAGHMLADPNGPMCGCGRKGCVESIASGTAIGNAGKSFWGESCDGKMVMQKCQENDPRGIEIIERSAQTIANMIADLSISLDIEVFKIGGSVGLASGYIGRIQNHLSTMPAAFHSEIQRAEYGADAGLVGVSLWAQE